MGLARQDQGARRGRCRGTSLTTSNADIGWAASGPRSLRVPADLGLRSSAAAGASAALALLDDIHRHRLRRAALHRPLRRSERDAF
jgi:hypothetical protein